MSDPIVYILDDDPGMRASLLRLCRSDGLTAEAWGHADELFERLDRDRVSCLVLDLRLEEQSGLDVQERLSAEGWEAPVIFLTGYGTIPVTVKAMRAGAIEFLTKPVEGHILLDAIRSALEKDAGDFWTRQKRNSLAGRLETLTPREREIFPLLLCGFMNKQLAGKIATSEITARVHKRRIMAKLGASTITELVRIADELGIPAAMELETEISSTAAM